MVNISNFSIDTFAKYSNRKFKSTNGKGEIPFDTGTKNAKSEKILINCTFIYDMYVVLRCFTSWSTFFAHVRKISFRGEFRTSNLSRCRYRLSRNVAIIYDSLYAKF